MLFGAGLKILLDWIDYSSAWSLDLNHGINNTYLVINYRLIQNFSTSTMDFSGGMFMMGISFDM